MRGIRRIAPPIAAAALMIAGQALAADRQAKAPEAPPAPVKAYTTAHVNPHAPAIDGRLDDPVWAKVPWEGGFTQRKPLEGAEPTEKTAFKVLYDDKNVYVGIRAYDSQASTVERRMSRRDEKAGDCVDITFDSYFDRYTGFLFGVNASGVKYDQLVTNDSMFQSEPDMSWDPIWDVATSTDTEGWIAEMRIPLSQLRFSGAADQTWGLQVTRQLFRKDEWSLWQPIPRSAPGWVHLFGELRGLRGLKPQHQVELMPYTVGKAMSARAVPGNPFAAGRSRSLYGGLDGKIGVTSDLTLNLTVNPDFGQVEADPSVVNLTAYETYYQEKRPFFVEGRNITSFSIMGGDGDFSSDNLFYSRRIGRSPQASPDPGEGGYVKMPQATAILGAFKLTGKTRSGWSIGVLESVTGEETASLFRNGAYADRPVEPMTSYFGARVLKDFNKGETVVGGMITSTLRNTGHDELRFLHDSAFTGGFNLSHQWRKRTYYASLKIVASRVQGTPEAIWRTQTSSPHYFQRPGADYLHPDPNRTSLSGHGGTIEFGKQGGGRFMFIVGSTWRSPGLELNDMGYQRESDTIMTFAWGGYRFYKPFAIFRNASINVNAWTGHDFSGTNIFNGGNVNWNCQLKNYWYFGAGIGRNLESLSSTALRGGPLLRQPGLWNSWFQVQSDVRRPVQFTLSGQVVSRSTGDMDQVMLETGVIFVPSRAMNLSVAPMLETVRDRLQYVDTPDAGGPRYLFAGIDRKTVGVIFRLNYSLTPDLTVQLYGQPFVAAGAYDRFKVITDSMARDYAARYHEFAPGEIAYDAAAGTYTIRETGRPAYFVSNPDFNFLQFRSNLVVRWEYVPGSTLFLVWSQGRTGYSPMGDFRFGRGMNDLFEVHPENVFLVKFSYCFNL